MLGVDDSVIAKWAGVTESYFFYNGEIELRYDPKDHVYLLVKDGQLIPQDGVTTVIHIIDKSNALIPWGCKMMQAKLLSTMPDLSDASALEIDKWIADAKSAHKEKLEDAGEVGKAAHFWIEQYIKQVLSDVNGEKLFPDWPSEERAKNCCFAAIEWMRKHNVRWKCTERKIYSRVFGYAGTMDGLALVDSCQNKNCCPNEFKDRLSLIDWKSSNYLYTEYLLQTAAYQQAYEEETEEVIQDRWIIRLGKEDGEFEPWHLEGRELFGEDFIVFENCLDLFRNFDKVNRRMKQQTQLKKALDKIHAKAEKEAQLKIKCKNADKYKGIRLPTCNGNDPCQTCINKYNERKNSLDKAESV